jgi:hypothetical protein
MEIFLISRIGRFSVTFYLLNHMTLLIVKLKLDFPSCLILNILHV